MVEDSANRKSDEWSITPPTSWDTTTFAGLRAILREDWASTPTTWHHPGLQALAVHRLGEWIYAGGRPPASRRPAAILHKVLRVCVRNVLGFEIHQEVPMGRGVRFMHQHGVVIGSRCVIGDGCVFHHGVTLAGRGLSGPAKHLNEAPTVGAGVVFGAGCIVLGGVRIGDGASIGPNAVVTADVPPGASVVAPAARILRLH